MTDVYIGLGSNLDRPVGQVEQALDELTGLPATQMIRHSALYRSAPVGPRRQADFVNAVAALKTSLPPWVLLRSLHGLERRHGRVRRRKWGPRSLDLDILLYGKLTLNHRRLIIPHPWMHKRSFVLIPLYEINAELIIPGKGSLGLLVARLNRSDRSAITKIERQA